MKWLQLLFLMLALAGIQVYAMDSLEERDKKKSEDHANATREFLKDIRDQRLMEAVQWDNYAQAELWLKNGAGPNIGWKTKDGSSVTPLLHQAVMNNNPEMVDLLIFYGADPHGQALTKFGESTMAREPFHTAAGVKEDMRCLRLLGSYTDVRTPTSMGYTALDLAVLNKRSDLTAYLLSRGVWVDINKKNEHDHLPLILACAIATRLEGEKSVSYFPNPTQIKYLLCSGANPRLLSKGKTASEYLDETLQSILNRVPEEMRLDVAAMQQEVNALLTNGPTEENYEETVRDIVQESPLAPATQGNIFSQISHRQGGIAKPLSKEILHRKRIEKQKAEAQKGVPFNGTGCIIC